MREDMINAIVAQRADSERKDFDGISYSEVALCYSDTNIVPEEQVKKYWRDRLTDVDLPPIKKDFLDGIDWLYVYTLNFDDAIEKNSRYDFVILPHKEVRLDVLDERCCVVKLHGDAKYACTYPRESSLVFNQQDYLRSITSNQSLLEKVMHDFFFASLVFIGCSLDDELDLTTINISASASANDSSLVKSSRYYFTTEEPTFLKKVKLEKFGITHVVLFNGFDDMYNCILKANQKACEMPVDDLAKHKSRRFEEISINDIDNASYLFHGKSIVDYNTSCIRFPSFFIERDIGRKLLRNIDKFFVHLVYGPGVSGKTYLLASVKKSINDRDVYFFSSRERIPSQSLHKLLEQNNVILIFDTHALEKDTLFTLLNCYEQLKKNRIRVIITVNRSDRDVISAVNSKSLGSYMAKYELKAKLSTEETKKINELLAPANLPNFRDEMTLLDNLIAAADAYNVRNTYVKKRPHYKNVEDIMVLILLAVQEKLYTSDMSRFNIIASAYLQTRKAEPLISQVYAFGFEQDFDNSSGEKITINAKYWLYEQLGEIARSTANHENIIQAFRNIVSVLIKQNKKTYYIDYIKFDVINEIFASRQKGQGKLIRQIYERLNDLLASIPEQAPHYFHQRAKCILWQSRPSSNDINDLNEALRFLRLAQHYLDVLLSKSTSEKLKISCAHVAFTNGCALAKIAKAEKYANTEVLFMGIEVVYESIFNLYLTEDFDVHGKRRSEVQDIKDMINYGVANADNLSFPAEVKRELVEIYNHLR